VVECVVVRFQPAAILSHRWLAHRLCLIASRPGFYMAASRTNQPVCAARPDFTQLFTYSEPQHPEHDYQPTYLFNCAYLNRVLSMTAAYRIRQGLQAIFAFVQPVELPLATQYLTPELLSLFSQMRHSEQLHSLNVLRDILAAGTTPPDLAVAALLHDVGKSRYPLRTWQKTVAVMVRQFAPHFFERWSKGNPANLWMRPFVVYVEHPMWSAEMVAAAGASEAAIWLVAHHQETASRWSSHALASLLQRLQQADDAN
jgi:HD domain